MAFSRFQLVNYSDAGSFFLIPLNADKTGLVEASFGLV